MKKKIIIILLLIFLVGNSKVYADEYCDKLSEHKEYTNLCRYEFLDGTNPITANLYIGENDTMIEWMCNNAESYASSKDVCDGKTMQIIKLSDGEKEIKKKNGLFSSNKYYFNNNINSSTCPSEIYYYFAISNSGNNLYFKWTQLIDKKYEIETNYLSNWTKLEIVKDCSNAVVEPEPEEPDDISCDLIDKDIIDTLNEVMTYIRIGIPILLIGLIIFDFASAMFASSEDKMKKAQSKAIKRVIIAIIIFLVPTLINLILNIANDVWSNANFETCGLK